MDGSSHATFALAFLLFAASPGPDNITILSKTVNDGPAPAIAYGCGVVASVVGFVIVSALGLNALIGTVGQHLHLVRYFGAACLVFMGVSMWRAPTTIASRRVKGGVVRLFGLGFLLNASNPKMPVLYLALLPGVLGAHRLSALDTAGLLAVVLLVEALVIGGHVAVALRAKTALAQPRRLRALNRGAGALMVGAGALVAAR